MRTVNKRELNEIIKQQVGQQGTALFSSSRKSREVTFYPYL